VEERLIRPETFHATRFVKQEAVSLKTGN